MRVHLVVALEPAVRVVVGYEDPEKAEACSADLQAYAIDNGQPHRYGVVPVDVNMRKPG